MAVSVFLTKLLSNWFANSFPSKQSGLAAAKAIDAAIFNAGVVPVGSIVMHHASFTNCPTLPSNFVACNGQVLNDTGSVFNGQTIPDLNNNAGADGTGFFIRGSKTTTGTPQLAQAILESHTHTLSAGTVLDAAGGVLAGGYTTVGTSTASFKTKLSGNTGTNTSTNTETRPKNYSMMFIMRIK